MVQNGDLFLCKSNVNQTYEVIGFYLLIWFQSSTFHVNFCPTFLKNSLLQKLHLRGSSRTNSMCEFKTHFFIKSAPHLLHLFSSFWSKAVNENMWTTSMYELQANFFIQFAPHLSHLNGFCPSWTTSRLLFDPKLPTKLTFKHFYNVKLGYWKSCHNTCMNMAFLDYTWRFSFLHELLQCVTLNYISP